MGRKQPSKRGVRIRTYPSGKKAIEIQFQFKGVQCKEILRGYDATESNLRYAVNLKGEIERKIRDNQFNYSDYFPQSKRARLFGHAITRKTIKELLKDWLIDIERNNPHSTYRCYKKSCDSTLIPHLGNIRASDLKPEHIRDMIRSKDVMLKTIRNDLTPLHAVLEQAVIDNIIQSNPLDKIKVAKLVKHDKKRSEYEVDPFSLDEIEIFLNTAKDIRSGWVNYFQFAFYTGLRTSELYGLKWDDVDWQNESVRIQRAIVDRVEKVTKTESSKRDVDLMPMAFNALINQRPATSMKSEYVFINPRSNKPIRDYQESARAFKYVLKRSGLRVRNQYQTRHSYASNLLSGNENVLFVAKQMGHKDVQMVMRVYAKWIEQSKNNRPQYVSEFGNYGTSMEHGGRVDEETNISINHLQENNEKVQVLFSAPLNSYLLFSYLTL